MWVTTEYNGLLRIDLNKGKVLHISKNTTDNTIWGPKTANGWPTTGTDLVGSDGSNGDDGKSVLKAVHNVNKILKKKEIK